MIARPLARALARPLARPLALSGDYDPDAVAYFQRVESGSGTVISDPEKRNISNFIAVEKLQGRWSNAIEYWTLRNSQNAGTGTVLYGLKGLFNGLLVNGPSWGLDGITKSSSTQYITFPITSSGGDVNRSSMFSGRYASGQFITGPSWGTLVASRLTLKSENSTTTSVDSFDGGGGDNISTSISVGQYFSSVSYESSTSTLMFGSNGNLNVSTIGVRSFSSQTDSRIFGWGGFPGDGLGLASFGQLHSTPLTSLDVSQIYLSYKSTIGQGLGLP